MVHTHHSQGNIIRSGRDDDPFGATLKMSSSLLYSSEDISRHYNVFSIINILDVGRFLLLENGGGLSIDDKLPVLNFGCVIELAMGGIILEHVGMQLRSTKGSLMATTSTLPELKTPGRQVPNMAKSIYFNLYCHVSGMQQHCMRQDAVVCPTGMSRETYLERLEFLI